MGMKKRILDYMIRHGSITTLQAFRDLGCTRLSEYIRQIRQTQEVTSEWVKRKNRYGENVKFMKFKLKEVK